MHRPLRVPLHHRLWHLVRGLLFYNTVYWKKASDGLDLPTLSNEERERQRPVADLDVIRPRENPRAKLADGEGSRVRRTKGKEVRLGSGGRGEEEEFTPKQVGEPETEEVTGEDGVKYIKRRRYRRRRYLGGE